MHFGLLLEEGVYVLGGGVGAFNLIYSLIRPPVVYKVVQECLGELVFENKFEFRKTTSSFASSIRNFIRRELLPGFWKSFRKSGNGNESSRGGGGWKSFYIVFVSSGWAMRKLMRCSMGRRKRKIFSGHILTLTVLSHLRTDENQFCLVYGLMWR